MGRPTGHIELERTIDSILIGNRHRSDLGDIAALATSIEREGLLQPPTVTPEGVLVCGARRLAALRQLGHKTVNVWVRSGISDRLGQLMAEQDDDALHKPLTQTERATLYRELKELIAEDAERRQAATRFTTGGLLPEKSGGAATAPPLIPGAAGKARSQAALMVTGRNSYTSLEQVNDLQRIAADPHQPDPVRTFARDQLAAIDQGASISRAHDETRDLISRTRHPEALRQGPGDLELLASEALERARQSTKRKTTGEPIPLLDGEAVRYPLRAFLLTWDDLDGWWRHFDPDDIGRTLSDHQWARIEATITATVRFFDAVRNARTERSRVSA